MTEIERMQKQLYSSRLREELAITQESETHLAATAALGPDDAFIAPNLAREVISKLEKEAPSNVNE